MAKASELALYAHLFEAESLDVILREGLPPEIVKTDELRVVLEWSLWYYERSGRMKAPTLAAMQEEWGDLLSDAEITWDGTEPEAIEWVIDHLKSQHAYWSSNQFLREWSTEMAEADGQDRLKVLSDGAERLFQVSSELENHSVSRSLEEGLTEAWALYQEREASGETQRGLLFGLPEVDAHTHGIHEGELAIIAAPTKVGKSYYLLWVALQEWKRKRNVVLFSLENSPKMAFDRLICLEVGVDSTAWEKGLATDEEKERFAAFRDRVKDSDTVLQILQPESGDATMARMVRTARNYGAQSLIIDQLTHVEHPDPGRKARHEIIRDILHECHTMINSPRFAMSCLMAHQVNREGTKSAQKEGVLELYHLAEGSESERTADFVFGLFQSQDNRAFGLADLSMLAARRTDLQSWLLSWRPWRGVIRVRHGLTEQPATPEIQEPSTTTYEIED